jgi:hypothetical protein
MKEASRVSGSAVILRISHGEHRRRTGLSASVVRDFVLKSPFYVSPEARQQIEPMKSTPAIRIGQKTHERMFEGKEAADKAFPVYAGRRDTRMESYREFIALHPDINPGDFVSPAEEALVREMCRNLERSSQSSALLTGEAERSIFYRDPETRLVLKARPDVIRERSITDLKTTGPRTYGRRSFRRTAWERGYALQLAHYALAARAVGYLITTAHVVCVCSEPPHGILIFEISEPELERCIDAVRNVYRRYAQCAASRHWPEQAELLPDALLMPAEPLGELENPSSLLSSTFSI